MHGKAASKRRREVRKKRKRMWEEEEEEEEGEEGEEGGKAKVHPLMAVASEERCFFWVFLLWRFFLFLHS